MGRGDVGRHAPDRATVSRVLSQARSRGRTGGSPWGAPRGYVAPQERGLDRGGDGQALMAPSHPAVRRPGDALPSRTGDPQQLGLFTSLHVNGFQENR